MYRGKVAGNGRYGRWLLGVRLLFLLLDGIGFADSFVFSDSVSCESPFAAPAGDQIAICLSAIHGHLLLDVVASSHGFDLLFGLGVLAEGSFVLEVLF